MDSAQRPPETQLQQLQIQLRQLEQQLEFHQQQLQETTLSQGPRQMPQQAPPQAQQPEPTQAPPQTQQPEPTQAPPQTQQPEPTQASPQIQQQGASQAPQQADTGKQLPHYFTLPKIVSTVDIGHIQEMLSSNLLAVKQFRQAAKNCQLPDLKQQFSETGQLHLAHYNDLLQFLSENGGKPS